MKKALSVIFLLSLSICQAQVTKQQLDSIVKGYDSLGGFNGVVIVATSPGNIIVGEYGYKDPGSAGMKKISRTDRFDLASVSKQFTCYAVIKLINEGLLKPDYPIGKYFPELDSVLQKVTVRQLANHTNGIHDYLSLSNRHDTLDNYNVLQMLTRLDSTVFTPGTKWGYTNSGYVLLAMLVERVTHMWMSEYVRKIFLKPLRMKTACYSCPEKALQGYTDELEKVRVHYKTVGPDGLYASANDMIAYYKAITNHKDFRKKYFTVSKNLADASKDKGWDYGFGWFFTTDELGAFRAHAGRNPGASTYIRWYEEKNVFICVLSNKCDDFIKPLREEVCKMVIKAVKK